MRHTPEQMFDLVADSDKYPKFLPLCRGTRTLSRVRGAEGAEVVLVEMRVGYKALCERFVTRNRLDRQALRICVDYVEGPFRNLHNVWGFLRNGDAGCRVDFYIEYEFRSRILAALMGSMFDTAFRTFASAFEARAEEIYGVRSKVFG